MHTSAAAEGVSGDASCTPARCRHELQPGCWKGGVAGQERGAAPKLTHLVLGYPELLLLGSPTPGVRCVTNTLSRAGQGSVVPLPIRWQLTGLPSAPPSLPSDSGCPLVPFATGALSTPNRKVLLKYGNQKAGVWKGSQATRGIWAIIPPCLFLNFNFTLMISEAPFPHLISKGKRSVAEWRKEFRTDLGAPKLK